MHEGQNTSEHKTSPVNGRKKSTDIDGFVLEKTIFSNIFEKDIKRVYIYKKSERLAKAVSLIAPAFTGVPELQSRADRLSLALIDAALQAPRVAREALARELLALSSLIGIARVRGLISAMNAELIAHEAQVLLDEIAGYETPHLSLPEAVSLPTLARRAVSTAHAPIKSPLPIRHPQLAASRKGQTDSKGHSVKDNGKKEGRAEAILSVLREKGATDIKGISTIVRHVSEKTIQRELTNLIHEGTVVRSGTRRWTAYSLAHA